MRVDDGTRSEHDAQYDAGANGAHEADDEPNVA